MTDGGAGGRRDGRPATAGARRRGARREVPPLPAAIRVRRRADGTLDVALGGVSVGRVAESDWRRLGWHDGEVLEPADAGVLSAALARQAAHAQALRLLAVRDRSRAELARRLASTHGPDAAAHALEAVAALLDDERFAREWVRARQRFRPVGPPALVAGLRRQGVAPDLARRIVAEELPDRAGPGGDVEDALAACRRAADAYARKMPPSAPTPAQRARIVAHLSRRGFSYSDIQTVMRQRWDGD